MPKIYFFHRVVWDNVRLIKDANELVIVDGVHLGKNKPDTKGNRYCVNLSSISGNQKKKKLNDCEEALFYINNIIPFLYMISMLHALY